MRIAQVSDCFAPRTGGIETQVASLSVRQVGAGHDVRVITATPDADDASGPDALEGVPVHRLTASVPFELPIHPRTGAVITRDLQESPVDVLHVHVGVVSPFAWGAIRAAQRLDIPVLVTVHSMWGSLAQPGYAIAQRWADVRHGRVLFSAVSSAAAAHVTRALPSLPPVRIIANGIDEQMWSPTGGERLHSRESGRPLQLVSVMRMAPRKRTLPLIRMVEAAIAGGADIRLTLVGDGPERSRAERYVARRGLAAFIRFTGRLSRPQIQEIFRSQDLFIQPSVQESFGIAALEARTAGLPVLARSQSGTVDFIHDGCEGVIVDDDAGMSRALLHLASDSDPLARMAEHNRSVLPDQVWSKVLGEVESAYASVIAREHLG